MYINVNFNVFFKLIKVHFLVSEFTPLAYVPPLVSETNFNIDAKRTQNLIALNFSTHIFLLQTETQMILYQTVASINYI